MESALRELLRRGLSPKAFELVRMGRWYLLFYFPSLVASWFVKRKPEVYLFRCEATSDFAHRLRDVNALAPTRMCRVMTKHDSDKGNGWCHNYTTVYSALLKERSDRPLRILELGLGTNNPKLPSSMGVHGRPGASLRGWREIFPRALVYGADIDRVALFQEDRIKTFYCDQCDQGSIRDLWSQSDLQAGTDVIIDDGLHAFEANVCFLEGSIEHLCPGGTYIIEDIKDGAVNKWCERLEQVYSKRYPSLEFALVALPAGPNLQRDNNIVVVHRRADEEKTPLTA